MGNIIGDPIHNQILKQVKNRQKMSGAGYNSESIKRDPQVLNYLNNRNSWIKMASGVSISGSLGEEKIKAIFEQSSDQTVTEQEYANLQGIDTYLFVITEYYSLHAPPPFHKLSSMVFLMKFGKSLSIRPNCVKYIIYNKSIF